MLFFKTDKLDFDGHQYKSNFDRLALSVLLSYYQIKYCLLSNQEFLIKLQRIQINFVYTFKVFGLQNIFVFKIKRNEVK
jgi:hypothetical protein